MSKSNFAATPSRAGGSYKSRAGSAVLSLALAMLCCFTAHAAQPDAATVAAYDAYLETAAADLDAGVTSKDILWANDSPERISRLRAGEIIAEPSGDEVTVSIEGGEISDVVGAVFIPGQSIDEVLALIQDYDSYQEDFAPEITESKLISREANRFNITIKFVKTFIISIGYNVEQAVDFVRISDTQWQSRARVAKLAELKNAGTSEESVLSDEENHGYLWRMFTCESFEQVDGGVIVESRAVTLSAPLPLSLSWMASTLAKIPQDSLVARLEAVRAALQ